MPKKTTAYVALLRGINVGGANRITKEQLQQCCTDIGFKNVRTYIQSGNIVFTSFITDTARLTAAIESELSQCFQYNARAVVFTAKQYENIVQTAPATWAHDDTYKHNLLRDTQRPHRRHTCRPKKIIRNNNY